MTQLLRVTLDHNSAPGGGGIYNEGALELNTSTLSDNTGGHRRRALSGREHPHGALQHHRRQQRRRRQRDLSRRGPARQHQLQRRDRRGWVVRGDTLQSEGNNLEKGNTCGFDQATDRPNTDPLLQPLAANGGLTRTRMPDPGSAVVDNGGAGCASPDQRGEDRPLGAACDIGAVEAVALPPMCGADLEAIADTTVSSDAPDAPQGDWLTLRRGQRWRRRSAHA